MRLVKFQSTGSDHIIVQNSELTRSEGWNWSDVSRALCNRKGPFGADGFVVVSKIGSEAADCSIEAFTPDGNQPDLCINGILCAAAAISWDFEVAIDQKSQIATQNYKMDSHAIREGRVFLSSFGSFLIKEAKAQDFTIYKDSDVAALFKEVGIQFDRLAWYDVGTPQLHFGTPFLEEAKLERLGHELNNISISPNGLNVSAVYTSGKKVLTRTFERGGGGLTNSCASAASCSAIFASADLGVSEKAVTVVTKGGEYSLRICKARNDYLVSKISGIASPVYSTEISKEDLETLMFGDRTVSKTVGKLYIDSISEHDTIRRKILSEGNFGRWCKAL